MWTRWEGEGETNVESRIDIYAVPCVKQKARGKLLCREPSSMPCDDPDEWDGVQVGGKYERRGYMYKYS